MAEVKWIKIVPDVFDDDKIKLIESMPEGDSIIVIWFKLLCLAGKQNRDGFLMLNDKIAYTDEMLATVFRRPLNTVRLALNTFENFDMIEIAEGAFLISKWDKYQNVDKLTEMREYNKLAQQKSRSRKKLSNPVNDAVNDMSNNNFDVVNDMSNNNFDVVNDMSNNNFDAVKNVSNVVNDVVNDKSMTCQPCQDTDKEQRITDKEQRIKNKDIYIYTTTTTGDVPTLTEVFLYFKANSVGNAPREAEKFHAYNTNKGWTCLPNWKATADLWISRIGDTS